MNEEAANQALALAREKLDNDDVAGATRFAEKSKQLRGEEGTEEVDQFLVLLRKAAIVQTVLQAEDFFQVLGMTRATFDENKVKKAHLRLMRDIHPGGHRPPSPAASAPCPAPNLFLSPRTQTSAPPPAPRRRRSG